MKKRALVLFLSCAMVGTSVAPVYAAEDGVSEMTTEEELVFVDTDLQEEADSGQEAASAEDSETGEVYEDEMNADEFDISQSAEESENQQTDESDTDLSDEFADDFADDAGVATAEAISTAWEAVEVDNEIKFCYIQGYDQEGKEIYTTKEDGIVTIDGNEYLFDENGYMLTGRVAYNGSYYFFMDEENAEEQEWSANAAGLTVASADAQTASIDLNKISHPLNSNLGQMQKDYWRWTGKAFEYYGTDGAFISVSKMKANELKAGTYRGYYKIRGSYFALQDNGVPRTGDYEITEGTRPGLYYFNKNKNANGYPGAMAQKTWVHLTTSAGERWRYYDGLGRTTLGIKVTKLDKTIDPSVGDREYLLSTGGYLYTKPTMAKTASGDTYICDSRSIIYKDKVVSYKGARYYVTSSGKLSTFKNGWKRLSCMKNRPYYFGSTPGKISEKTGWVKVTYPNGSYAWYLFTENGNAYINTWKGRYYFDENGVAARGMKTIDGKTYYFKPSTTTAHNGEVYKNSLITYKNNKYYAGSDGALYQRKWAKINGNYYYFQQNRTLLKNAYARKNGVYGYVDSTGKFTTGWVIVDASANKVRYLNPKAKGYLTNTYKVIDGVRYYFDKDGYRVSDLTSYYPSNWKNDPVLVKIHNGSYAPYYLECDKTNGVITIYTGSDKKIPIRTVRTSVGAASTPTPSGTYTLTRSLRWQPLMGPSWGQYGTHVVNGIYIHSVAGSEANSYSLPTYSYDILGTPASHGCLRVCVADAKWIYENCSGATIKIFNGTAKSLECDKGPLGRNPLVPRYGSGTFDPTDPNV